jgi:hypothetical protein
MCDESIKRAWLVSNALNIIVNISFNMEAEVVVLGEGFKILNEFDS